MNREQKRMAQRQGQDPEGEAPAKRTAAPARRPAKREPFRPGQFLREVRSELRQVAWPNRSEVVNYTTVTLVTLAVIDGPHLRSQLRLCQRRSLAVQDVIGVTVTHDGTNTPQGDDQGLDALGSESTPDPGPAPVEAIRRRAGRPTSSRPAESRVEVGGRASMSMTPTMTTTRTRSRSS